MFVLQNGRSAVIMQICARCVRRVIQLLSPGVAPREGLRPRRAPRPRGPETAHFCDRTGAIGTCDERSLECQTTTVQIWADNPFIWKSVYIIHIIYELNFFYFRWKVAVFWVFIVRSYEMRLFILIADVKYYNTWRRQQIDMMYWNFDDLWFQYSDLWVI